MLGHSKTILVLLGGWAFLGDPVSAKQLSGMALAVLGMVLYGVASSLCAPVPMRVSMAAMATLDAQHATLC